jgi:two-component system CheB/CheR fusion protein
VILPADSFCAASEHSLRQWADVRPLNHVVGIGASAGGLEALKVLLGQLKLQGLMTYVVAQPLTIPA